MTQVVFINGRVVPDEWDERWRRNNPKDFQNYKNSTRTGYLPGINSDTNKTTTRTSCANNLDGVHYDSNSRDTQQHDDHCEFRMTPARRLSKLQLFYLGLFMLLSFCSSGFCSPESRGANNNEIQMKIRSFLESHCNKQNQSVEQMEFENFISCNPTQAATTFERLKALKEVDGSVRHEEIQREINKQCDAWPQERSCQKKNFALIQKCFYVKQRFVFYFMLALTDTICKDGDVFIQYWEKGGDVCLQDHLKQLSNEISQCFKQTSTNTTEDLDRNIGKITSCIGEKFRSCGSAESAVLIDDLLSDLAVFYGEIKNDISATSSSSSSLPNQSASSLAFLPLLVFSLLIMQPLVLSS